MKSRQYSVTLTGLTPLLMHHDNITSCEMLKKWRSAPGNKAVGVAGDDRSPAFTWIGSLYSDGGRVSIPADNLMTMLREGGSKCPTGKGQKTFKAQTQSGIVVDQGQWDLETPKGKIEFSKIKPLMDEMDFEVHEKTAQDLGFMLFVKRARIGAAKHIRVRPRFDRWSASGTVTVLDEAITTETLQMILDYAGTYCGMCDWRPSSPRSPGSFGKFEATIKKL
jgi:hypothetical protein